MLLLLLLVVVVVVVDDDDDVVFDERSKLRRLNSIMSLIDNIQV